MRDSFVAGDTQQADRGQLAQPDAIAHSERLVRKLYPLGDKAWSLVGNGLSNQTFVEGPEGLIVIDTGECNEEMAAALAEVRQHTDAPVVACIYTHFHYVGGTRVLVDENPDLPIWGHSGIEANLNRFGGEIAPRVTRGLVQQFAIAMPTEGQTASSMSVSEISSAIRITRLLPMAMCRHSTRLIRRPAQPLPGSTSSSTRRLQMQRTLSRSGFPELDLAVNNLLWPALFNVFAIRGEEYRDPRILLRGLDQLGGLDAEYLAGAHGPPLAGKDVIRQCVIDYRDTIQFMWDQTVRCANLGLTLNEAIAAIELPEYFKGHYTTRQLYGLVEHHVRQIYTGLFGWFDEDEAHLFPVPAPERAQKLINGFGGIEKVREAVDAAMADNDYRWAIELASWLVRSDVNAQGRADAGTPEDRGRLAEALRQVAQSTTSANVRNWCITRALELEEKIDLTRFRVHRLQKSEILRRPAVESLTLLRVLLVPAQSEGFSDELRVQFSDGSAGGLAVRHSVAVPVEGTAATLTLAVSHSDWAELLAGKLALSDGLASGQVETSDAQRLQRFFACFDVKSLNS